MTKAGNSQITRTITLLITISSLSLPAYAKYSGGTGEPNDPYQIATDADLIALGETPDDYDKHFILTTDIDLDPNLPGRKVFDKAVIAHTTELFGSTTFTGVFDGDNHTILNLTVEGESFLGLFGQLKSGAYVKDLGVVNVNITGSGGYVGGLLGSNYGGSVTKCYSTGTVKGDSYVGGLVGCNGGNVITASYSIATVSGDRYVGGLAGGNGGTITTSYSTGTVNGSLRIGGLVGENYYGHITASYSTTSVSGETSVGGLVGADFGSITTCYSAGQVTGEESVGGLVGKGGTFVLHCIWDMEYSNSLRSAGGVGLTTIEMMDPFMIGLNGFTNDPNWILDAGLDYPRLVWEDSVGQNIPEPNIHWLEGQGTAEEPYRIDTADQLIRFDKASILWDKHFVLGSDIDLDPNLPGRQIFNQAVIPSFWGVFDGNNLTISNLTITGQGELGLFGRLQSGAEVKNLGVVDVNIIGIGEYVSGLAFDNWGSITNCFSTGILNGNSIVGGLVGDNFGSITKSYSLCTVIGDWATGGLVGENDGSRWGYPGFGTITDCYSSGTISGSEDVGGLVGSNRGTINISSSTGTVTGNGRVGGLVGGNSGSITMSYSNIMVKGNEIIGGLIGANSGDVSNSYSNSFVTGESVAGGLVGRNGLDPWYGIDRITDCYCTGTVSGSEDVGGLVGQNWVGGSINSSFWDIQTSSQINMCGSQKNASSCDDSFGKTTAEMQMTSTFLEAGWDFVGETANGTEDIWWIDEGNDYPRLWWEAAGN